MSSTRRIFVSASATGPAMCVPAYQDLAEAYIEKSRYDEAIEVLQKAMALSKGASTIKGRLGFAYARAGRSAEARAIRREMEEDSKHKYVSPVALAIIKLRPGGEPECDSLARDGPRAASVVPSLLENPPVMGESSSRTRVHGGCEKPEARRSCPQVALELTSGNGPTASEGREQSARICRDGFVGCLPNILLTWYMRCVNE